MRPWKYSRDKATESLEVLGEVGHHVDPLLQLGGLLAGEVTVKILEPMLALTLFVPSSSISPKHLKFQVQKARSCLYQRKTFYRKNIFDVLLCFSRSTK